MRIFLLVFLCALIGCAPQNLVTRQYDDWTGFSQVITAEFEVMRSDTAIMTARGIMLSREGQHRYAVLTNLRRLVPNGPIIRHMHSGNTRLDYRRHDRLLTHCIDRCRRAETGVIHLTKAAFEGAGRTGLPLRIQGRRGRYEAYVPSELFSAVLNAPVRAGPGVARAPPPRQ